MKQILYVTLAIVLSGLLFSCKKDEIATYRLEDAAVEFVASSNLFSLKGVTAETVDFAIPVKMYGPKADYPRDIAYSINDIDAKNGVDYEIISAKVDAGALSGKIIIRVKMFKEGVDKLETELSITQNESFKKGIPEMSVSRIIWSKQYVRPKVEVWRYWYTFLSPCYSQAYHELLYNYFGEEIERYTNSRTYANNDPNLIFKLPSWWFSANRAFRDYVKDHDLNSGEPPLRHSADYQKYSSYNQAFGTGEKAETPPTILETLNML